MTRHLFTTEPPAAPRAAIPLARAMICVEEDCGVIFLVGGLCPNCSSDRMVPLETWLGRVRP